MSLLAAIGQVESGSLVGRPVDRRHRTAVLGPVLDGHGYATVADTDAGRWDGNATWDRAVGPMQFIPGTWRTFGVDGDGDGVANPQDVEDAAASTAAYLCYGGRDLSDPAALRAAILSYNHSPAYLGLVLTYQERFAGLGLDDGTTVAGSAHPPRALRGGGHARRLGGRAGLGPREPGAGGGQAPPRRTVPARQGDGSGCGDGCRGGCGGGQDRGRPEDHPLADGYVDPGAVAGNPLAGQPLVRQPEPDVGRLGERLAEPRDPRPHPHGRPGAAGQHPAVTGGLPDRPGHALPRPDRHGRPVGHLGPDAHGRPHRPGRPGRDLRALPGGHRPEPGGALPAAGGPDDHGVQRPVPLVLRLRDGYVRGFTIVWAVSPKPSCA